METIARESGAEGFVSLYLWAGSDELQYGGRHGPRAGWSMPHRSPEPGEDCIGPWPPPGPQPPRGPVADASTEVAA